MNMLMDIVLLVIMIPTLLIMFFYEYPAKWHDRKFIFGVRNREEFRDEKVASEIDRIAASTRKQALIIMICSFVLMGLIMLIPDELTRVVIWVIFILADIIVFAVPFMNANREMKSLKRAIGIVSAKGKTYTDLKGAGVVSGLKIKDLVIPDIVAAAGFVFAMLYDQKVFDLSIEDQGSFVMTSMTGTFLFIGIILIPIAVMMDRVRNEVISENSDTNINYNRAKKKSFADMFVLMTWANTAMIILSVLMIFFANSDITMVILMSVYMLMLMASLVLLVRKNLAIDKRYRKDTTIDIDDDDRWILGSFYYNPDDRRLNVAKRMGIGGTINLAHPAGKVITAVAGLFLIFVVAMLVLVAVAGKSSMSVRIENGTLICNHYIDSIKVSVADIEDPELCNQASDLKLYRQVGFSMPPIYDGTFIVDGQSGCKVFLNTDSDVYLKFVSDGVTYYVTGSDDAETVSVYGELPGE